MRDTSASEQHGGNSGHESSWPSFLKKPNRPSPGARLMDRMTIIPGLRNDDLSTMERFMFELITRVHDRCKSYQIPDGAPYVTDRFCYPGMFSRLTAAAGYYMFPCGCTPAHSNFGSEMSDRFRHNFEQLLEYVCDALYGVPIAQRDIEVNKLSSTTIPDFTYDVEYKYFLLRDIAEHMADVRDMVSRGAWMDLLEAYRICMAFCQTWRIQPDSASYDNGKWNPKIRTVADYYGNVVEASKAIDGSKLFRKRVRLAAAAGFGMSQVARMPERLFDYGVIPMFKVRGAADLSSRLQGWEAVRGADATQFDQSIPIQYLEYVVKRAPIQDWLIDFLLISLRAPFMIFGDSPDTKSKIAIHGDLTDPTVGMTDRCYGLPSGHPWVSFFGRAIGAALDMAYLVHIGAMELTRDDVFKVLYQEHPSVRVFNTGDDVLIATTKQIAMKIDEIAENDDVGSFSKLGWTYPTEYIGYQIQQHADGSWIATPRMESMLANMFSPERGIPEEGKRQKFRQHWGLGFAIEAEYYGTHPLYPAIAGVRDALVHEFFGYDWRAMVSAKARESELFLRAQAASLTMDELLFLANPDRRHYGRVDMSNVRDDVRDSYLQTVRFFEWAPAVKFILPRS